MDQVVDLALDSVRNHRVQECVYHLKGIAATLSTHGISTTTTARCVADGPTPVTELPTRTASLPGLLKEGLSSQALVNHSEGGAAILGCLSAYLSAVSGVEAGRRAAGEDLGASGSATTSADFSSRWRAVELCKHVLRYHVKTLFFFVKSGNAQKQVQVMLVFESVCRLSSWMAVDLVRRVDWAKILARCKGYSMGRAELGRLRARKRRRTEGGAEAEGGGGDGGEGPLERDAYVNFMVALMELDLGDVWDRMCTLPVLLRTLLSGFVGDGDPKNFGKVVRAIRESLLGGRHWRGLPAQKRQRLFQKQHFGLLCAAAEAHNLQAGEVSEILLGLFDRRGQGPLFPLGDRDFLLCSMASHSSRVGAEAELRRATEANGFPSADAMVGALRDYAIVANKSLKYAGAVRQARWFNEMLSRDPLMGAFLFSHWRPVTSQQPSVVHFAPQGSALAWLSKASLVLRALSGLGEVYRSIQENLLEGGAGLSRDLDLTTLAESCVSAFVIPSAVVEKNSIMKGLQAAILHDNRLAVHTLLQVFRTLLGSCSKFLESIGNESEVHVACEAALKAKVLTVLPDMKFLLAVHVHFRDQLYAREGKRRAEAEGSDEEMSDRGEESRTTSLELVVLQSLACQRKLGEVYTLFGFTWGQDASKCISDEFPKYGTRHKIMLLEYLRQAADANGQVTFSSSWKSLSMLIRMLFDGGERSKQRTTLEALAEDVITKVLLNTHLFEAYPAEVGIWVHNLRTAGRSGAKADELALLADFFSQAVYQAIGKVTDFVFYLQNLSEKSGVKGGKFGPLILLVVQQCCSLLSSAKRSKEEKKVVADYVSFVTTDLVSLTVDSQLLRKAILQLVHDSGSSRRDSPAPMKELSPLLSDLSEVLEGSKDILVTKKLLDCWTLLQHRGERFSVLSFFNYLTMGSGLMSKASREEQISIISSLHALLDSTRIPEQGMLPYQAACQWFETLSICVDLTGTSILDQEGRNSAMLCMRMTLLLQKAGTLFESCSGAWGAYLNLMDKFFCLLVKHLCGPKGRESFSMTRIHQSLLLEVLGRVLEIRSPSSELLHSVHGLLGHANAVDGGKIVDKIQFQFQLDMLHTLLRGAAAAKGLAWQNALVSQSVETISSASGFEVEDFAPFITLCATMLPSFTPFVPSLSHEFLTNALLKSGSARDETLFSALVQVAEKHPSVRIPPEAMVRLEPRYFVLLCPVLDNQFQVELARGGDPSEEVRKLARHSFERSTAHLLSMDFDPQGVSALTKLHKCLLQGRGPLGLDVSKALKVKLAGAAGEVKNLSLIPPLVSAIGGIASCIPEQTKPGFAAALLAFMEDNDILQAVVRLARSKVSRIGGSTDFLCGALEVLRFVLEAVRLEAPGHVASAVRDFVPVFVKRAFDNVGMFRRLAEFASAMRCILQGVARGGGPGKARWFVDYATEVVDLLFSHSSFQGVLFGGHGNLDGGAAGSRACVETILPGWSSERSEDPPSRPPSGREALFLAASDLVSIGNLFSLYDTDQGTRQLKQLRSMLLSAYGCRSSPGDAALLRLMKALSGHDDLDSFEESHYLWGEAFRSHYVCSGGAKDACDLEALKYILLEQQLGQIRVESVVGTIHSVLGAEDPEGGSYDPKFLLSFARHHVARGTIDLEAAVSKGLLSLSLAGLSSDDQEVRRLALETLDAYLGDGDSRLDFKGGRLLADLLRKARAMVEEAGGERLPAPAIVLASELVPCLLDERSFMHATARRLLDRDSTFDSTNIPVFLDLLHSSSPDYLRHQLWLLRYLWLSLAGDADLGPFRKRFALEVLMGFATAPLSDPKAVLLVLQMISKASRFPRFAHELVYKRNVLPWLLGLARSSALARRRLDVLQAALEALASFARAAAQGGWRVGLSSCNDVLAALPAVADAGHGSVEVARALAKVADEVCRIESDEVDGSLVTMARKRFAPAGVSETSCVP